MSSGKYIRLSEQPRRVVPFMKQLCSSAIILIITLASASAASMRYDHIAACLTNLSAISSYDVMFRIDSLQYANFGYTNKADEVTGVSFTWTNRDVFSSGVGRRIEDHVGESEFHVVSVIDWNSAISTGKPLAHALARSLPGFTYHDYFNPIIGNRYLSDVLSSGDSDISFIATNSAIPGAECYRIVNSKSSGVIITLWLDPRHSYIPARVEWSYLLKNGRPIVSERMDVAKVIQVAGNVWVPARATNTRMMTTGATAGRAYSGQTIEIDPDYSLWNSVRGNNVFSASDLSEVNVEKDGWKSCYPPSMLTNARTALGISTDIAPGRRRIVIAVLFMLTLLPLLLIAMRFFKGKSREKVEG